MDETLIASTVGLGMQAIGTILQSYVTFKKSNVEKYFELLISEQTDLSSIGNNELLKRLFYAIIENVSKEIKEEKILNWKNLTVKLATEFDNLDFSENFLKTLENLSSFDLTVLFGIYSQEFESKYFGNELEQYFQARNVDYEKVSHSLKALARYYLIKEQSDGATYLYNGPAGQSFYYEKNKLGEEFLGVISN